MSGSARAASWPARRSPSPSGGDVVCRITNTAISPTLTLIKQVVNDNGGTAEATEWTLTADGPTPVSGSTGDAAITDAPVQVGTYDLSESGPTGYTASAWECTGSGTQDGASVTLAEDQHETCVITNNDLPAQLTLEKTVTNTFGGTAIPTDWVLSAAGPTPISGTTGSGAVTNAGVSAGTYTLSESGGPGGYTAGDWSCTGGTVTDTSVVVPVGGDVTCTINNSDQPAHLTLIKEVDAAATGSGKVPADWTLTATPVGIDGQDEVSGNGDPTSPGGVNRVLVFSGGYALSEDGPAGFDPSEWVCQGGVLAGTSVTVPSGGDVVCRITNTAISPTLTLIKQVVNDNGGTAEATEWTLTADGPTPVSGSTGDAAITEAPVQVGTYDLSESGPTGYTASAWECTGSGTQDGASVTLAEDQHETCVITNNDDVVDSITPPGSGGFAGRTAGRKPGVHGRRSDRVGTGRLRGPDAWRRADRGEAPRRQALLAAAANRLDFGERVAPPCAHPSSRRQGGHHQVARAPRNRTARPVGGGPRCRVGLRATRPATQASTRVPGGEAVTVE